MKNHEDRTTQKQKEALRTLEKLRYESEVMGTSSMVNAAKDAVTEKTDIDENDPIEILGKKIGRGLGIVAVIGLIIYLGATYF